MFLGTKKLAENLTFYVHTHASTTGIATDATAPPTYLVYEEETGLAILTGSMAKLDDANTTGFYSEQITVSGANGFEFGKSYGIYVEYAVAGDTMTEVHHLEIREESEKDIYDRIGLNGAGLTALAQDADLAALIATVGVAGAGLTAASGTLSTTVGVAGAGLTALSTAADLAALIATVGVAGAGLTAAAGTLSTTVGVAGAGLTALPAALLDKADGIETGRTLRQTMRLMSAMLLGKVSGGPGSPVYRNMIDTADRVAMTADSDGDRTVSTQTP